MEKECVCLVTGQDQWLPCTGAYVHTHITVHHTQIKREVQCITPSAYGDDN